MKILTDIVIGNLKTKVDSKQNQLVSGTNIKTICGKDILGDGNLVLTPSDVGALSTAGGTLSGNLTLKGSGNYGSQINLGDGDYVHISEPTDDCLEVKAKKVDFVLSDTSSTQFTINGLNPFNGGSGAIWLQGSGDVTTFIDLEWASVGIYDSKLVKKLTGLEPGGKYLYIGQMGFTSVPAECEIGTTICKSSTYDTTEWQKIGQYRPASGLIGLTFAGIFEATYDKAEIIPYYNGPSGNVRIGDFNALVMRVG